MMRGIGRWIGGDPWDVMPLHGAARAYIALLGVGSLLMAVGLWIDQGTIEVVEGWQYATPIALGVGGAAALWWTVYPGHRLAYAAAGSVLAATFLVRGAMALLTLIEGTRFPWLMVVGVCVWSLLGFAVLLIWRHLAPVIAPKRPPESPPAYG